MCAENVAQWVECLPGMPEALNAIPGPHKAGTAAHAYGSITLAMQAGESEVQVHL